MNELSVGTIVRVLPTRAYDEDAELNPGGLYMIREVDTEAVEDDCLTYRLGSLLDNSWASRDMIQPIDLKPGDLISIGNVPLEVSSVRSCQEDNDIDALKIIKVNTPIGHKWITDGGAALYGI